MLEVSRSGYYDWLDREPSLTTVKQAELVQEIRRIRELPRHDDYGSPRMHRLLLKNGYFCCENTVARLMRQHEIKARTARKFRVVTTDSGHDQPIAKNLLEQRFEAERPNRVWLTDFTYIPTKEGFTYLCTIEDLYSRRIVGWATGRKIDTELALKALMQAVALRSGLHGLILHSDRGSQFASYEFRESLQRCGFLLFRSK